MQQTRLLRDATNKIPLINPYSLYSVYDDFSNGDLAAGSINGTTDLKAVTRTYRDTVSELSISSAQLNCLATDAFVARRNAHYAQSLATNTIINVVFNRPSGCYLSFGFTDLATAGNYNRPTDGIYLDASNNYWKRVSEANTALGIAYTDSGTKTSWCLVYDGADITAYVKTANDAIYSLLASFSATPSAPYYLSFAMHSASPTPLVITKFRAVDTVYASTGQLEALFPLD